MKEQERERIKIIKNKIVELYPHVTHLSRRTKECISQDYERLVNIYTTNQIINALEKLSENRLNNYIPQFAEIVRYIDSLPKTSLNNMNLNSSYWYINLRKTCEEQGIPYYDITKGPSYPLPPYKD